PHRKQPEVPGAVGGGRVGVTGRRWHRVGDDGDLLSEEGRIELPVALELDGDARREAERLVLDETGPAMVGMLVERGAGALGGDDRQPHAGEIAEHRLERPALEADDDVRRRLPRDAADGPDAS